MWGKRRDFYQARLCSDRKTSRRLRKLSSSETLSALACFELRPSGMREMLITRTTRQQDVIIIKTLSCDLWTILFLIRVWTKAYNWNTLTHFPCILMRLCILQNNCKILVILHGCHHLQSYLELLGERAKTTMEKLAGTLPAVDHAPKAWYWK